jgi:hypoxanthine-DNA glycosylase
VTMPLLHGLPPIIDDGARVLILGNMPSVMSLGAQEYYANPRNAFWRIMGEIFGFDANGPYDDRTAALRAHGIAVWDVLRSCRRVGSLDSAVEPDSMVANDFGQLFEQHPSIRRVFFNGAAAEKNFNRLVRVAPDLSYRRLPSTSPAQTMPYTEKLAAWREAITARQ